MQEPAHAIAAVTHPDPWAWYAARARDGGLAFDEALGLWVVAAPAVVREALAHPQLRVRPPAEPVPKAIAGTPLGEVFACLVRMTDGEFHARHKPAVRTAASQYSLEQVAQAAAAAAQDLAPRVDANAWLTAVPVQAMARVLGVPAAELDRCVQAVHQFTQAIGPNATPDVIAAAQEAVQALMAQGEAQGLDRVRSANRIAFMQQSLDACAALLGGTLLKLQAGEGEGGDLRGFVGALATREPPVHNTRRFAAEDLVLAGVPVRAGQGVLVLLAAAQLPFGDGAHACPGERIAIEIVAAAAGWMRSSGRLTSEAPRFTGQFRPLPNARIPLFA